MSVLSAARSVRYTDFLTFGRSDLKIFAVVAGETVFLGATFFVAEPPFLPVAVSDGAALIPIGLIVLLLAIALYVLLSGLGHQTYSVKFHSPVHILKCWAAYLTISTVITYIGYLLLVYPYTGRLVPQPVDIGIGSAFSAAYAISIASIVYGRDYFSDSDNSKSEDLDQFLTAAQDLKEKPESYLIDEPDRLIQAGESLLTGLQTSDLGGTSDLAADLQDWLETFNQRELQGQKKMVGDLPHSSTQFSVWEDRYEAFQDLKEQLEKMDSSAIRRVLLSFRSK